MSQQQEFLKLLDSFDNNPSGTLREWHRVLNHILNNLTNGSYVATDARNVSIDDAGSYFVTKHVEYALQYLASGLLAGSTRVTTKTTAATLTTSEFGIVLCDSATPITLNLPACAGNTGASFFITNINVGTVTIDPNGAETIQGDSTFDLYQDENIQIVCTGTSWKIR